MGKEREIDINVEMPRLLIAEDSEAAINRAEQLVQVMTATCAKLINQNKDVQLCMNMINHVFEHKNVLNIALNEGDAYDIEHFRMMIAALTFSYEEGMKGQQVRLVRPINFKEVTLFGTEAAD
jgi:hypothetical protein